jgi:tetratricopeptide (TPR) repeat protein
LGDAQIAQAELERAVALGSVNPRALLDLASAYLYRYRPFSCGGLAKEEYCRAETVCRQAISLEGDTFEAYLLLGRILNGEVYWGYRDDDGGVAAAQKAISLDPNSPDGYCALTNSYRLLNRYEDALAAYEVEASIRTGNEPIGKPKLGRLHIEGWRSHELIDLQTAAEMCSAVHEYARALNYLDRAQKLVPDDEISYYWAGQIYLKLGDIDRARGEQEALAQICKRRSSECVGYARYLLDEIEQGSRQGTH